MTTPAEVLAEYSRAFERDPEQAAMGFYSEDIVLRVPGAHPYAGTHRGRDRAIEALSAWAAATNGTLGPTEATMVALATDTAVVHVAMTATRHGRSAQWERMILYRFRNRRICEVTG